MTRNAGTPHQQIGCVHESQTFDDASRVTVFTRLQGNATSVTPVYAEVVRTATPQEGVCRECVKAHLVERGTPSFHRTTMDSLETNSKRERERERTRKSSLWRQTWFFGSTCAFVRKLCVDPGPLQRVSKGGGGVKPKGV